MGEGFVPAETGMTPTSRRLCRGIVAPHKWPIVLLWSVSAGSMFGCFQADPEDRGLLLNPDDGSNGVQSHGFPDAGASDTTVPKEAPSSDRTRDDDAGGTGSVPLGFACDSPVRGNYHPPGYDSSS